jgi:hypothetical protein
MPAKRSGPHVVSTAVALVASAHYSGGRAGEANGLVLGEHRADRSARSRFFAMPSAAIETHMVSQVLSLEEIPGVIVAHTMRT